MLENVGPEPDACNFIESRPVRVLSMQDQEFDKPVQVAVGGAGRIQVVNSTARAAEILLTQWPDAGGRKHHAARKACLDVLQGLKQATVARRAFEAATKEAGIHVDADFQRPGAAPNAGRDAMRELMVILGHPKARTKATS